MFPKSGVDKLEECNDIEGTEGGTRGLAVEEKIEELKTDRMALIVQPIEHKSQPYVSFVFVKTVAIEGGCTVSQGPECL